MHVPVKPLSSSAVSVPSQVVPLANRSCSAVSETSSPPVRRSIRNADCDAAVPLIETMPEPSLRSIVPVRVPLRSGTVVVVAATLVEVFELGACWGSADSPSTTMPAPAATASPVPSRRGVAARPNRRTVAPATSATVVAYTASSQVWLRSVPLRMPWTVASSHTASVA